MAKAQVKNLVVAIPRHVTYKRFTFDGIGGPVTIDDISLDQDALETHVIDVLGFDNKSTYKSYAIGEVVRILHPIIAINAGASSGDPALPAALGLVVDNNKVVTALNPKQSLATGVFCIDQTGRARIFHVGAYRQGTCREAVQSGPVVIEPHGVVGILQREDTHPRLARFLTALDRSGKLHFLATTPAHLYDLAQLMVRPVKNGGMDCTDALNLATGDRESALYFFDGLNKAHVFGNLDAPVPTVIVVQNRV